MQENNTLRNGITVVTAFFPIGRTDWETFTRSDDTYFNYFERWARLHNDLIVFTIPQYAERVEQIRQNLGRTNTIVHAVEDYRKIDKELLERMTQVCRTYAPFSMFPDKPEPSKPYYNYVIALKYWCMKEAAKEACTDKLAWIDFGFDHGGVDYKNLDDYDFEWNYPFEKPVTFFQNHELGDDPIFEIVRRTDTYFQGKFICYTNFAEEFYQDIRSHYISLIRCGLVDDDQTPPIMCVRERPDIYHCLPSGWFSMLYDYSDVKQPKHTPEMEPEFLKVGIVLRLAWAKRCLKTLWREFKYQVKRYPL
ncbi:WlaTC/HtrL family glycosyltransferase [Bifidobacterium samirii]|uniref:HtrL family protein n=1 Tax=Bifidobacterium samirii TaxID=2306974 RepID=A0A430FR68_9BIFI|nr:WlaTC/HtrL family glycosyltransferase [Bifidobacterium samirii]RSX55314.1 hypothetical protein D2E24_1329 [Bifidobacterium samirii]